MLPPWTQVSLRDITFLNMGQSPPSETYNGEGTGLPFLQGKADFGEVFPVPSVWCSAPQRIAKKHAVLVSIRAPVGDVNLADQEYCIGRGLAAITPRPGLDKWFLYYWLVHSKPRLEARSTGSTFDSINKDVLASFSIALPPLPEQRAIARILRTIQAAREARQREVALERERKAALMAHLFTRGTRGEPTKQTPIGEMPESWEAVKLGRHTERPGYGLTTSAMAEPIGPKFLRITDIQHDGVDWESVPYCECDNSMLKRYLLKPGDVVIARIGATTGKAYLIRDCPDAVFASYLIRVRAKDTLHPSFLGYLLQTKGYWQQIVQTKGGRLKGGVNIPILQGLDLPLPSLPEQLQIAGILQACDAKIAALEGENSLLDELFRALLEELMTGRLSVAEMLDRSATLIAPTQ